MAREPMPDVVVLIPGILGSALSRDGREMWAMSPGAALRALLSLGGSIAALALDGDDPESDDLGDGVTATRVLPDLHLIPGLWKIDGYSAVAAAVRTRFEVTPGRNYFEFPYDWRRDIRANGRRLAGAAHQWLSDWRSASGNPEARLVLLAHSMGGLVARVFLEIHEGWRSTRSLITFGTPYRGSLDALMFLANGFAAGIGPLSVDLGDLFRSMTSVYQLLPRYPVVTAGTGLVRVAETDVPGVDRTRASEALAFHLELEAAVERNRSDPAYVERGYRLHPVVGIGQPTLQSASIVEGRLVGAFEREGRDHGGDGTVPRVSALPLEAPDAAAGLFSPAVHSSLQNSADVLAQVIGILSAPAIDLHSVRSPGRGVSIDLPDAIAAGDPLVIRARSTGGRSTPLAAAVVDADHGAAVWEGALTEGVDWHEGVTSPLPPGIYRVTVSGEPGQVSDLAAAIPVR